ncbi:MAG: O-antigen ligase family protein [Bacteroidales bacterium]|nr:O-antigen ligase family protein [Bacteroidales bacterium]MDI9575453.1 O-antigen ligase family protein [Bacteroidota bacterium]MDY0401409.1 O-antigen ligase family protein [Bacteroidales bacterium]
MLDKSKKTIPNKTIFWIFLSAIILAVVNTIAMGYEFYYVALIPFLLLLLYYYFFSYEKIFLALAVIIPFSITIENIDFNLALSIPSEPILLGLLILALYRFISNNSPIGYSKHSITITILIYFVWLVFSAFFSQIPVVSWKFVLAHAWLMIPAYFLGVSVFFKDIKYQNIFLNLYLFSLVIIVIIAVIKHAGYNFDFKMSYLVSQPFYRDHTIYGAALSLIIPFAFMQTFNKTNHLNNRILYFICFLVLTLGLILSSSRAAWVSTAIALVVGVIILLGIKFRYVLLGLVIIFTLFFINYQSIMFQMERNPNVSRKDATSHVRSITNISTDLSNTERINRWVSAIRIAQDHPVVGSGPGTYQFIYAPYQLPQYQTYISTNTGTKGNAHSEFLGPLSETGIPGMLTVIAIVISLFVTGFRLFFKLKKLDTNRSMIVLSVTIALLAYFLHGLLNNFLDTDKIAYPVWAYAAILTANYYWLHWYKKEMN